MFTRRKIETIDEVVKWRLCAGCGACAYADPERIQMVDDVSLGRRPVLKDPGLVARPESLQVCPGIGLEHASAEDQDPTSRGASAWGPVLEVWEGHASDGELRFSGSSGGAASALALYALERGGAHGVLHTRAREDIPYLNRTVLSRTRADILACTGSRYSPASPCDGLAIVEAAPAPCVFVGKPCDVAALRLACGIRPALGAKLFAAIAIFCAGTPSARGTLELIWALGIRDPSSVTSLRYRGNGWPGDAVVRFRNSEGREEERCMSYVEAWGDVLQRHRQWRCHVCADHTGEFADVALADPWYLPILPGEPGRSLVVVRTERGRALVAMAREAGYLAIERVGHEKLPASQPTFEALRGALWSRLLFLRILGVPAPRYRGFPMFRYWWRRLGWRAKLQSTLGTIRRVYIKRLTKPETVSPFEPPLPRGAESAARALQAPKPGNEVS